MNNGDSIHVLAIRIRSSISQRSPASAAYGSLTA